MAAAASCARRAFRLPYAASLLSSSARSSPSASRASNLGSFAFGKPSPAASPFRAQKLSFSRLPVELGGTQSLMPLHSVTASALFTSLLRLSTDKWGCLSEVFATPL